MNQHIAWPSIVSLENIFKTQKYRKENGEDSPKIKYLMKIKLHGTNSGLRFVNGVFESAQSRTQDIYPGNDNDGFAAWAASTQMPCIPQDGYTLVIHGEWAGKGIQSGTALNLLDGKKFFIFAVERIPPQGGNIIISNPKAISHFIGDWSNPDVHIIPWASEDTIDIDFSKELNSPENSEKIREINAKVEDVERQDPYIKSVFGVDGIGEGYVLFPSGITNRDTFEKFIFKAKGEKHRVVKSSKPIELNEEKINNISQFCEKYVTDGRCNQAISELKIDILTMQSIGQFIKWMQTDIQKECQIDLNECALLWKDVNKKITELSTAWFKAKIRS